MDGSQPRLPLWFKHFAPGPDGAGEAYHIGVFGKTGSGKSDLAKMILTAYARYPQMALLVIDPQGEFAKDIRGKSSGEFQLPLGGILKTLGKRSAVLSVRNLVLDTWALFEQILFESLFFERLSIPRGENRQLACEILGDASRQYSFMTIGPVSPLSFAGTPLFLYVFNSVEVFMGENHLTVAGQA